MPLNWDATNIQYFKDNPDDLWITTEECGSECQDLNPETKSLVFGTMSIGIGNFTESTIRDIYARWMTLHDILSFPLLQKISEGNVWEDILITKDVLKKHIGLTTNASKLADTTWCNNVSKVYNVNRSEVKSILGYHKFIYDKGENSV
jgi:hypothetical protein